MKNLLKHLKGLSTEKALDLLYENFDMNIVESKQFYKTESGFITMDQIESGLIDYKKEVELIEFKKPDSEKLVFVVSFFGGRKVKLHFYDDIIKAKNKYYKIVEKFSPMFAELICSDDEIEYMNSDEFEKALAESLKDFEKIKSERMERKKYWWLPLDNYNQPNGNVVELDLNFDELEIMKNKGEYVFDSYYQAMLRVID